LRTIHGNPNRNLTQPFMVQLIFRRKLCDMCHYACMIHSLPGPRASRQLLSACLVALACLLVPPSAAAAPDMSTMPPSVAPSQADSERARAGVRSGEFVPLERIVADAQRRHPGRILEIELEGDEYEIELLTDGGVQVELEYDARTGQLLEVEYDD
jgi:hypothetical protein